MEFQSKAVLALVRLHELEMKRLLEVWKESRRRGVSLPETEDPDYKSLDHLLRHPLRASRGYLTWVCDVLDRPEPGIPAAPDVEKVATDADTCLDLVLAAWREHLAWMSDDVVESEETYRSRWGMP